MSNPLFFKYNFFFKTTLLKPTPNVASNFFFTQLLQYVTAALSYSKNNNSLQTNVVPALSFTHVLKKNILRLFNHRKFSTATTSWHYLTIIKFLEYCSGRKIYLNLSTFLDTALDAMEKSRCLLWSQKLRSFKKAFGAKLFLTESLEIIYTSLKLKDPYFFSNWLLGFFYKMSFWKYKLVFRYLQYVLRYFFQSVFSELYIKGLKFQLKGKVSVAGNSRTRTVVTKIGSHSHATFNNKVLYNLHLLKTFTGVIGFKTWLIF
jgi:hypothetical protein